MPISKTVKLGLLLLLLSGCAHLQPRDEMPLKPDGPYLNMLQARYAEHRGSFEDALMLYAAIDDPYARLSQARILWMLRRYPESLVLLDELIAQQLYVLDALELRCNTYTSLQEWPKAEADAESIIGLDPTNLGIKLHLAKIKVLTGRIEEGRGLLMELLRDVPEAEPEIRNALADICIRQNDFVCARRELERTVELAPYMTRAWLDLGQVQLQLNDLEAAEQSYLVVLESDPFSVAAHKALAQIYIAGERYRDALMHVSTLMDIAPQPHLMRRLAMLELKAGMYSEVLDLLKKQTEPDDLYLRSIALSGLGRFEDALEQLEAIEAADGLNCDILLLKASLLVDLDRLAEARGVLELAWQRYGQECPEVGLELANLLEESGERSAAIELALKVLELQPENADALNFVGYLWADAGVNLPEARQMIERALQARPDDGYILDSMGWVLYRLGQYDEAFSYMERALQAQPEDAVINEHMGDVLVALGMPKRALDYYLKASLKRPGDGLDEKIRNLQQVIE